jgi:Vacuolar sorting 38 and autophagy-related subunit 14
LDEVNYRLVQSRRSLVEELLEAFALSETDVSTGRLGTTVNPVSSIATNAWNASGLGRHASKFGSEFFLRPLQAKKQVEPSSLRWTIGNLVLPSPSEIRTILQKQTAPEGVPSSSLEEINAAIGHTLHFLTLLCFYLGVKLPFEARWSKRKPGVGVPFLKAGSGPVNGNWAK